MGIIDDIKSIYCDDAKVIRNHQIFSVILILYLFFYYLLDSHKMDTQALLLQIAFEIIDINRMKFSNQKIDIKHGCRNFARLWGNKDFFRILAQYYAEARNANTEKCIKWVLQARNKFWKRRNHSFYEYE